MPENSAHGLTLLDPDHEVIVTGEEDHQDALRIWAPQGRPRRVAVELRPAPLRRGRAAGESGLECLLDGRRIGELTPRMSVRYRPFVDEVLRRGERPGAVGLVRHGRRGLVEVELRLPDVDTARPAPLPAPVPPGPRPAPRPDGDAPRPGRLRTPLLVGGGVAALLVAVITIVGGGERDDPALALPDATPTSTAPTPTPTTTPTPTGTPVPTPAAPARTRNADRPAATPQPRAATPLPTPQPLPSPEPTPEPDPPAVAAQSAGCHPSYDPCLPPDRDVDCGEVDGPVLVTGPDEYRLDRDDDGVGCET